MHNANILPICPGRVVPVTLTHQISHGEESSESKQLYELYEQCKSLTSSELIRRINLETPHQIVCFVLSADKLEKKTLSYFLFS